jgi:2-amino-4-hydroxy-6-hydroxymethyldihydropteridine diphosphokinase
MSTDTRAFIGLGSNLDDPPAQVRRALDALREIQSSTLVRASGLYRTPPWGVAEQPPFINAVAELHTALSAPELLQQLIAVERAAGRVRAGARWGPRVLDLDLLLYGDAIVDVAGLHVPHPHLQERAFVLLPLAELAPDLAVPGRGKVGDLLARVDLAGCERLDDGKL